jgi:metal-sulfur cluster biosynthetic enzyme
MTDNATGLADSQLAPEPASGPAPEAAPDLTSDVAPDLASEPVADLAPEPAGGLTPELSPETEDLLEALRDVVDPELGVNVVDLGLVYGVTVEQDRTATIDMTLTSAACPLTDVIEDQTASALEGLVNDFRINWVWLPPWGPDKITEDGREQLRALGFNV